MMRLYGHSYITKFEFQRISRIIVGKEKRAEMIYDGLIIMVVGVIVVFSFLALIVVFIQITSFLVQKWTKETGKTTEELPSSIIAGIIALAYQRHLNSR